MYSGNYATCFLYGSVILTFSGIGAVFFCQPIYCLLHDAEFIMFTTFPIIWSYLANRPS